MWRVFSHIDPLIPPYGSNWGHNIIVFIFWPCISLIIDFTALEYIKRYFDVESLDSWSDIPPGTHPPPYGSYWGHKIGDFVFLPYISFIVAFTAYNVSRGYRRANTESLQSQ